jgi:hypothetical protein
MATATWTYEVAPAGSPSVGLEEYGVEDAAGEFVGTVVALLRRDGELLLAIERGLRPVKHDVRAVPWEQVDRVERDSLTVRLKVPAGELEAALELPAENGVEEGPAEARRVTELPPELTPPPADPAGPGPVDRPAWVVAVALGLLGVFSALILAIAASTADFGWEFALFAVPAVLFAAAGVFFYRWLRDPQDRRRAGP